MMAERLNKEDSLRAAGRVVRRLGAGSSEARRFMWRSLSAISNPYDLMGRGEMSVNNFLRTKLRNLFCMDLPEEIPEGFWESRKDKFGMELERMPKTRKR